MYLISQMNFNKLSLFNFALAAFPLSFIAGNMIININILLITFLAILFFKKQLFQLKYFFLDKLIFLYFSLILITALINDFYFFSEKMAWMGYFSTVIKSIFFLKYLLLYIVLRFLIEKNIISLKFFFISCSFSVFFVSFDIFLQFVNGNDIFGFVGQGRKLAGPFGDELIAGGFIQRFSLFAFFLLPLFFYHKISKKFYKFIIPIFFIIFFIGLIIAGNRMPTLIFLFTIFLVIIFQKQTRKFLIPFIIIFSLVFTIIFKSNDTIRVNFIDLYAKVSQMSTFIMNKDFFNKDSPQYLKEFSSFYDTWLMNKYVGGGIKNFRYYCHERPNIKKESKFICNMHPHNYYLEILTETGIFGFFIILCIFFNTLYLTFIKKYFYDGALSKNNIIIPFIFLFIGEIFPLKSTGSFFTTGNATYIFLILGIMIGLVRKENPIENKI